MSRRPSKKFTSILIIFIFLFSRSVSYGGQVDLRIIENRGLSFNSNMYSDQIRLLKDFFRARGDTDSPWGYLYDNKTKEMVKSFQVDKGIKATGIVDKKTLELINEEIIHKEYKLFIREAKVNYKGDLILINKSSNTLHYFKGGKLYKSYALATGKSKDATPDGKHKVLVKYKNPAWGGAGRSDPILGGDPKNPLGKRWIGLSYGGGGMYGIHGNSDPSSIGKKVSLGCIRMFNSQVEEFYEQVKIGTPVWIGEEDKLISYGIEFEDTSRGNYKKDLYEKIEKVDYELVSGYKIEYDNIVLSNSEELLVKEGTHYMGIRDLAEKLGGSVAWNSESKSVKLFLRDRSLEFLMDSEEYRINDQIYFLPSGQGPINIKGKTYSPIKETLESLGYGYELDQENKSIRIWNY